MEEAEIKYLTRESLEAMLFEIISSRLLEKNPEKLAREMAETYEPSLQKINSYLSWLLVEYKRLSPHLDGRRIAEKDLATQLVHQYMFR